MVQIINPNFDENITDEKKRFVAFVNNRSTKYFI